MRFSNLYAPTLKEKPSSAELISQELLMRAGMVRRIVAGVYTFLPLGWKVVMKVSQIVREEMNAIGAQEFMMPIIQPSEVWKKSGRWEDYGPEMMKLKDRHGREFALGPTHEEMITTIVKNELRSYKQLPVILYQINFKYRDEIRPRFGIMRSREFVMKDAYSFHESEESLDETYMEFMKAYSRISDRIGVIYKIVEADTGVIGGSDSHELMVLANAGESEIFYCENCGYSASDERARSIPQEVEGEEEEKPLELVPTPNVKTVEDVSEYLGIEKRKIAKSMVYVGRDGYVLAMVRGDHEINEAKLKAYMKDQTLRLATPEEVLERFNVPIGFIGPIGLNENVKILADPTLRRMKNMVVGGMREDTHYVNANLGRDFEVDEWVDIRRAKEGEGCPKCGTPLKSTKGIELGHIFKLGTKYSESLDAFFIDKNGEQKPFIMGCYGWGITRTVAAVIEQFHDEDGIVWPRSIAPFEAIVTIVNMNDKEQVKTAEKIYEILLREGREVLLDDREVSPGFKFKDADLIGIPIRITVGKVLRENKVEIKKRNDEERLKVDISNMNEFLRKYDEIVESYDHKRSLRV